MKRILSILFGLALVLALAMVPVQMALGAAGTTVYVTVLDPSWDASGGGGVFSAYVGPPAYGYVSPGSTALYLGREAGIIKAGLTIDPDDSIYEDEGLFAFRDNLGTIDTLAAGALSYDVVNQYGANPVWMTIEIDTGVVGDRSDNTVYQYVPTTNPASWHTVNAAAGLWQKWNDNNGDTTGNPKISLSAVAAAHTGLNVTRVYLRLGMGNSYGPGPNGTQGWVDKVTIGTVTYDFALSSRCVGTSTGTGTAHFAPDAGTLTGLSAAAEGSLPAAAQATKPINFPNGLFSFNVTGLSNGQTVTVTITLPSGAAPTQYWKYHASEGGWIQIPMTVVGPSNVISITLVDGGLGDDDGLANGVIVDQGGPGTGTVGWETYPISKVRVLLPWIALLAAIAAGVSLFVLRRRRTQT